MSIIRYVTVFNDNVLNEQHKSSEFSKEGNVSMQYEITKYTDDLQKFIERNTF